MATDYSYNLHCSCGYDIQHKTREQAKINANIHVVKNTGSEHKVKISSYNHIKPSYKALIVGGTAWGRTVFEYIGGKLVTLSDKPYNDK